jgi:hypothetical protein
MLWFIRSNNLIATPLSRMSLTFMYEWSATSRSAP